MDSNLHLVLGSADSFDACRQFVRQGDAVLLADAGVMALAGDLTGFSSEVRLLALHADVAARGLLQRAQTLPVQLVDDAQWAELVTAHTHTLSWK
ncbi:MAG: hypothetical protein KJO85_04530 [Gammaproteobacteria bacterium]|nr:hypothetical protein [Gammaproteobacteria bacterium]